MNQIARCDWLHEQVRWSHLAHSGLPALSREKNFPESQMINPLLTRLFWSRWLDIGLAFFFLRVYACRPACRPADLPAGGVDRLPCQPSWSEPKESGARMTIQDGGRETI